MLVILRHAEPRRTENDPELTSFGHRTALEAGAWVAEQVPLTASVRVLHTPTNRTRQTAAAVVQCLGNRAQATKIVSLPETVADLDTFADRLMARNRECPSPRLPPVVLVGHHTTLVGLARELGLEPSALEPNNHTAGIALERDAATAGGWRIFALRTGRPPN
ncbi:MAG: hypothetical protein CL927_19155 [Deltaproteobacteria bacterium]|nr:hypothetical protein [Deltaproteobacteria bacterium]